MSNIPILLIQVSMATLAYSLLYAWYVRPRLARQPLLLAVQPLLFVQMFRFTGLSLIAEGQVDPSLPTDLLAQAHVAIIEQLITSRSTRPIVASE